MNVQARLEGELAEALRQQSSLQAQLVRAEETMAANQQLQGQVGPLPSDVWAARSDLCQQAFLKTACCPHHCPLPLQNPDAASAVCAV